MKFGIIGILLFSMNLYAASNFSEIDVIQEEIFGSILDSVVKSKSFGDYKAAKGFNTFPNTLMSSEVSSVPKQTRTNSRAYIASFTYKVDDGMCTISMPVHFNKGSKSPIFGDGFSNGGCGE
jgi:hypothetical protein